MAWQKAPSELIALLDEAVGDLECVRKQVFGYPAYFANDNMFVGLHQNSVIIRLSNLDREAMQSSFPGVAAFEPMPGRPMREYVVVPVEVYSDKELFGEWLRRSLAYASALPPREKKAPARGQGRKTRN